MSVFAIISVFYLFILLGVSCVGNTYNDLCGEKKTSKNFLTKQITYSTLKKLNSKVFLSRMKTINNAHKKPSEATN